MKANRYHFRHTSRSSTGWPVAGRAALRARFIPGPNRRRRSGDWPGSVRLAIFGVVLLFLCLYAAYRCLSTEPPAPVQAPALPQIEFHHSQPIRERLDPQNSA